MKSFLFTSISALLIVIPLHAMEPQFKKLKSKEDKLLDLSIQFANRVRLLENFVHDNIEKGNWQLYDGQFALKDLLNNAASSDLITRLFLCGVRADIDSKVAGRTFFIISAILKINFEPDSQHFPRKNLLSALAIPSYQDASSEIILDEELPEFIDNRKCRLHESINRVKTFLLYANRDKNLKQVRFIILAHLPQDIFCQGLFQKVAQYIRNPNEAVACVPIEWVKGAVQELSGAPQMHAVTAWAPAFAFYRLSKAKDCIARQEAFKRAQGKLRQVTHHPENILRGAQRMVDDLTPEGFVERHMPECTKIITNLLLSKEPFNGFDPF